MEENKKHNNVAVGHTADKKVDPQLGPIAAKARHESLSHMGLRKHISHNNAALLAAGIRQNHRTLDCSQCVSMLHGVGRGKG